MELKSLRDELAILTGIDAPSGFEEPILKYGRERLEKLVDEVTIDVRGNLYARMHGIKADAPVVMVMAHADEIGFMVTGITPDGFLRFVKLGGPTDMVLPGQRVRILARKGSLEGIIGVKPGHIMSGESAHRLPPPEDLYIDIGASSVTEAESWGIEIGTPVVFRGELTSTHNPTHVFGKAIDNRAGVLVVLKAAEALSGKRIPPSVIWCLTVEEETGLRGAAVASRHVQPDIAIAIDTVPAGGTPELKPDELPGRISRGPLIKVRESKGLSTHPILLEFFRHRAEEHDIPYQLIVDTAGITDAAVAQQAGGQVAAITLGIARRFSHSAVEMCDLNDVQSLINLLIVALPQLRDRNDLARL